MESACIGIGDVSATSLADVWFHAQMDVHVVVVSKLVKESLDRIFQFKAFKGLGVRIVGQRHGFVYPLVTTTDKGVLLSVVGSGLAAFRPTVVSDMSCLIIEYAMTTKYSQVIKVQTAAIKHLGR